MNCQATKASIPAGFVPPISTLEPTTPKSLYLPNAMNRFRRVFNRTNNMGRESSPPIPQAVSTHSSSSTAESWTTHYSNLALLECLSTATPKRPALPAELILLILDHPTRWVHLHGIIHPPSARPDEQIVLARNKPTGKPVLVTRPFTANDIKCVRKVVFTFRSRDQGFCSHPDRGCWSWFEARLARLPLPPDDGQAEEEEEDGATTGRTWNAGELAARCERSLEDQPRYRIQENRIAGTEIEEYTVELSGEHELVRRVREGDRVLLLACACFPGWENQVYAAEISVWGVDDLTMGVDDLVPGMHGLTMECEKDDH